MQFSFVIKLNYNRLLLPLFRQKIALQLWKMTLLLFCDIQSSNVMSRRHETLIVYFWWLVFKISSIAVLLWNINSNFFMNKLKIHVDACIKELWKKSIKILSIIHTRYLLIWLVIIVKWNYNTFTILHCLNLILIKMCWAAQLLLEVNDIFFLLDWFLVD